jgi:hypothetical protein
VKKTNNVPGRKISAPPTIPSNRIRKGEPVNEREVTNAAKLKGVREQLDLMYNLLRSQLGLGNVVH